MASQPGPAGGGSIDFGRAFQFYFEDPDWLKKTLIGGALFFFGLVGLVALFAGVILLAMVNGYMMRVMQRAYAGDPRPLPEWEDYGGLMRDGFKLLLLWLGYGAIFYGIPMVAIVAMGFVSAAARSDAVSGIMALFILLMQLLTMVLGLGLAIYMPSAVARMTLYQRLGAGFEFKENLALIKRNPGNYFLAFLIVLVVGLVASVAGCALCLVGIFFAVFWAQCVQGYVLGEVVRRDPLIGQPLAPAPEPTPGL